MFKIYFEQKKVRCIEDKKDLKVRDEENKIGNEEMQDKKRCRIEQDEDKQDEKEENQ